MSSQRPLRWLDAQLASGQLPRVRRLGHMATLAGVAAGLMIIVQAGLFAMTLEQGVVRGGSILPWLLLLVGAVTARHLLQLLQQQAGLQAAAALQDHLRSRLLTRLGALGPAGLAGDHSGGLASRLQEQVDGLEGYVARYRPQRLIAFMVPLAILAVAAWLDWIVGLLLLLAAPLIPLFMALVGMGAEQRNQAQLQTLTRLAGHFGDRVRGLTSLRLLRAVAPATAEVGRMADAYRRASMSTLRIAFLSSAVLEFFAAVAIATIAIYVGFGLLGYLEFGGAPELTLFSGLFLLLLAPEFFQPLRTLAQHYHDRAAAIASAEQIRELLERPGPASTTRPRVLHKPPAIEIDALQFAYPGRAPVLRDLSLRIAAGEQIALTGASGSGKTTLLRLLAGFLEPTGGRILIDGQPAFPGVCCTWISQRAYIAAGTIADNIAMANPQASADAIARAAELTGVSAFAAQLPAGLDTPLGEQGLGLSGGQAQRVALARAWLAPAPLLLLDEPTASLDAETEALVLAALQALCQQGRTLIVASHHPGVIRHLDRVIRLEAIS